jgi:hypothetical protein
MRRLRMQRLVSFLPAPGEQRLFRSRQRCAAQVLVALGDLPLQVRQGAESSTRLAEH